MAAAVGAIKNGASVFLAEGLSCLGGAGTAALVPMFVELSDGVNFLAGGFGWDIFEKLKAAGGTGDSWYGYSLAINSEIYKRVCDEILIENEVDFTLSTSLIGVIKDGSKVTEAVLSAKSGIFAIEAKQFIDATGDGDLSAMAGADFELGDENGEMQPGSLCSQWTGIDWSKVDLSKQEPAMIKALEDGAMTVYDRHFPGGWQTSKCTMGLNGGHAHDLDATDERSLTKAYVYLRKRMPEYENFYKKYMEGFENIELVNTAMLMGIRETRRIKCDYQLNLQDFHDRAVFDDEIGRFSYAVDMHRKATDKEEYEKFEKDFKENLRYKPGENYGIPYRTLTVSGFDNLLVAGRCISVDRYIQASIRVMPGCFITGQAVGIAAALAVKNNTHTRGVPVKDIQQKIKDIGGFLPNFK